MMNKEIKAEWLKLLRSGEYKQCKQRLCKDGAYCCLGILTEIAVSRGVAVKVAVTGEHYFSYNTRGTIDDTTETLPNGVMEWAGLANKNPNVKGLGSVFDDDEEHSPDYISLAELNDRYDYSFEQIADIIESEL